MIQVIFFYCVLAFVAVGTTSIILETPCQRELRINTNNAAPGARIPVCDKEGNYAPKQCSGSQCYCVTRVSGTTIPGYSVNRWEAQDQNCQCARDKVENTVPGKIFLCDKMGNYKETPCQKEYRENTEATNNGAMGARIPKCGPDGHYDPKQCSGSQCYCVTRIQGKMIPGYSINVWEAQDQNCRCARDKYENTIPGKIFLCDEKGNYRFPCNGYPC